MSIIPTPTNPKPSVLEIKAFLASLHQHPGGPSVTSAPISFANKDQKKDWKEWFPDSNYSECFTYSQFCSETCKTTTSNRIALLYRPARSWIGVKETNRPKEELRALGIAWIKTPDVKYGKDLVVFDVECRFPNEVTRWEISAVSIIPSYVQYSALPRINRIWYWQDTSHRSEGKCLKHTLEWLKELTLIGDEGLSAVDWESRGFAQIGLH